VCEHQPADQRQFPQIVEPHDRHARRPVVAGNRLDDDRVVVVDLLGQRRVPRHFVFAERVDVRRFEPRQVFLQARRARRRVGLPRLVAVPQITVVDVADRLSVLAVMRQKLRARGEIEPAGQVRQFGLFARQFVDLLVVHELQRVFDVPQKHVPVGEQPVFVGVQKTAVGQPHERVERFEAPHGRFLRAMNQLQILHDELDVANGALSQLHLAVEPAGPFEIRLDLLFHQPHAFAHRFGGGVVDQRFDAAQELGPQRPIAGDDPRFEVRLFLPQPGVVRHVRQVRIQRRDQFAGPAPRTEPHVDAVHEPDVRYVRERLDQPLSHAPVHAGAAGGHEQQIDVGTVIQLLAPQLAHRDDRQAVGRDLRIGAGLPQARLHQRIGQQRQLHRHAAQVEQAEKIADADPQQFPPLKSPQRVQLFVPLAQAHQHTLRFDVQLLHALQIGQPLMLGQPFEVFRVAQQNLRQELAADEQPHEDFDRARVVPQKRQKLVPVGDRLPEPLEIEQGMIRLGRVGEIQQQCGEHGGEKFLPRLVGRQPHEPFPCQPQVSESDRLQQPPDRRFRGFLLQNVSQHICIGSDKRCHSGYHLSPVLM
jgi:hypothetical protein